MISRRSPLKQRIRDLGERLDAHRKRQQEQHHGLTLTGMYNVLEKLRAGDHRSPHSSPNGDGSSPPLLTAKEKQIHNQGLVTLLKQLHDELDEAVLEAYGWSDLKGSAGVPPASVNEEGGRDAHAPLLTRLPAQVTLIRQLRATDPTATAEHLSSRFGRKNAKRSEQIEGIIETLRGLGQVSYSGESPCQVARAAASNFCPA